MKSLLLFGTLIFGLTSCGGSIEKVLSLDASITLNEKEAELAELSYQHTEKTIQQMESFIDFTRDFKAMHQGVEEVDFTPLDAEMKNLNEHISKGVKLSNKLIKKINKRKAELSKEDKYIVSDLYLYERGQEDFNECYYWIWDAKNDEFEQRMTYLMRRMSKARFYMVRYQWVLEELTLLK